MAFSSDDEPIRWLRDVSSIGFRISASKEEEDVLRPPCSFEEVFTPPAVIPGLKLSMTSSSLLCGPILLVARISSDSTGE